MQSGRLDELITFEKPIREVSETGSETFKFIKAYDVKSYIPVKENTSTPLNLNGEIFYSNHKQFQIRNLRPYLEIDENYRIIHDNKKYQILNKSEDKKQQKLIFNTELINE